MRAALTLLVHVGYVLSCVGCLLGTTLVVFVGVLSLLLDVALGCFGGDLPERLRKPRI